MLRSALALLSAVLLSAMLLTGCGIRFDDGPTVTQTRDVGAFERISIEGAADVVVQRGPRPGVTVRGGEKSVKNLTATVRDGTLEIDQDDNATIAFDGGELVVTVTTPRLTGAVVDGAGDLDLGTLEVERLELTVRGAGDVTGRGRVGTLSAFVEGSGDLELRELQADRAKLDVEGSGDADVTVSQRLDVRVEGAGDVTYGGDPAVHESIDGAGDVERR